MTIPSTGPISFSALRSEFKNTSSGSVSISELKYGGTYLPSNRAVPSPMKDIPSTNSNIATSKFRNSYRYFGKTYSIVSNIANFNLVDILSGWNNSDPVMADVTVNPGVLVSAGYFVDVQLSDVNNYGVGVNVYRYRTYSGCGNAYGWPYAGTVIARNTTTNTIRIQYGSQIYEGVPDYGGTGASKRVHLTNLANYSYSGQLIATTPFGGALQNIISVKPCPSFEIKGIPSLSRVYLDNKGSIIGRGGVGGRGGPIDRGGENGEPGGPAIRIMGAINDSSTDSQITFILNSSSPSIYGGGGGGGGGGYVYGNDPRYGGGGGGGGAGSSAGLGNIGGYACGGLSRIGSTAADGTLTSRGIYGNGGLAQGPQTGNNRGGWGGGLNAAGENGIYTYSTNGGVGGQAGFAIEGPYTNIGSAIANATPSATLRI